MKIIDCPKFNKCSAPLCPLDKDLAKRSYRDGESICFYVREFVKDCSPTTTEERAILTAIGDRLEAMKKIGGSRYRRQLSRAADAPSKRKALM